jgi:hypothetical protein
MHVKNPSGGAEPLFAAYECVVDAFLRAGGHTATVIRSPRALLKQYTAVFGQVPYAGGARIEEAAQDHVSVRGTTIAGHDFEWPDPSE